jgi:putative membrane protein
MERFKLMEYRLYKYITFPAMISSYLFGGWMILTQTALLGYSWLQVKLLCVLFLTLATLYSGRIVSEFAADNNKHSEKFYRIFNEVPTLLMIAIVFLVILKINIY